MSNVRVAASCVLNVCVHASSLVVSPLARFYGDRMTKNEAGERNLAGTRTVTHGSACCFVTAICLGKDG